MDKGPHPRILEDIFSVIQVSSNSQNNTKYLFVMTPAKFGVRQLLAVQRGCHQLRLACGRQRGSELIQSMLSCDLSLQTAAHPRLMSCRRISAIHWPIRRSEHSFRTQGNRTDEVSGYELVVPTCWHIAS
jgi:hypothetical protein